MDCAFDVVVIGAGVVGLSVAAQAARPGLDLCLVERHPTFGREISSRNSEVIHSGIYYPRDSLKARFCVLGREMLYELCARHGIPFLKRGKLVVASSAEEIAELEDLEKNGRNNGVEDLTLLGAGEVARLEPNVRAEAALLSPSTGIVDSHGLMKHFEGRARAGEAVLLYNAEVARLDKDSGGFRVGIRQEGEELGVHSRVVVNCAGLESGRIAALAGIDPDRAGYRIYPCKGEYFGVTKRPETVVGRLVYPVPRLESGGLGVHVTVDLQGQMKLGPNAFYVDTLDYSIAPEHGAFFYESARRYLPGLRSEDIQPDMSGIRPKLQREGEGFRDFVIRSEEDRGLAGLIDLIGIESPGLTAAPAIGAHVAGLIRGILD